MGVTVAESRGPVVIAREIARRLLPGLEDVHARHTARAKLHADAERDQQRVAERLAASIGSVVHGQYGVDKPEYGDTDVRVSIPGAGACYLIGWGGSCRLDRSPSVDLIAAKAIAKALQGYDLRQTAARS